MITIFNRATGTKVTFSAPVDPRSKLAPDKVHYTKQFQSLGCGHCSRVNRNETWVWRCGLCSDRTALFGACEDCGGQNAAQDRYEQHLTSKHGRQHGNVAAETRAVLDTGTDDGVSAVDRRDEPKGVRGRSSARKKRH